MFKKLAVTALAIVGLAFVVSKTDLLSYCKTSYRKIAGSVEDSVPVQFQIDRARDMIRDLEPEIRRSMHVIAKEEVEIGELSKRVDAGTDKAVKDKSDILRLQSDLSSGRNVFHYAGHSYSASDVKQDLSRRFSRFKTTDATLESLRQMRDARERNLDAARQKLAAMIAAERQLQVEVENLEAKLKLVQVAEASSDFQFDDSQLARCKELITDIRTKLDVAAKLASVDENYGEEIPLDEPAADDVEEQVAQYFGLKSDADAEVAAVSYSD
jgi:predicted  nucleic acid-binding Zn-ribbon protein